MTSPRARPYSRGVGRISRTGGCVLGTLAVWLCGLGTAQAGEPTAADRARAAELVQTGAVAAKARRWDACIRALSDAFSIDAGPTTAGQLGLCEEQAGKLVDAYDHLHRAVNAAPSSSKDEPWKTYKAALARVLERVAVLWVTVHPREARVLLDGRPLGRADGRSFAVEPGAHTITARLDGYEDKVHPVSVRGGDVPHVHLRLTPKPAGEGPKAASPTGSPGTASPGATSTSAARLAPATPPPDSSVPAPFRWCLPGPTPRGVLAPLACAAIVTTVASGATTIGLEVDRKSLRDQVSSDACRPTAPSRPELCDALAERVRQRNGAFVVTIGAALASGVLAGAARVAFGFEPSPTRPTIAPAAGPNGGGIVLVGAW